MFPRWKSQADPDSEKGTIGEDFVDVFNGAELLGVERVL